MEWWAWDWPPRSGDGDPCNIGHQPRTEVPDMCVVEVLIPEAESGEVSPTAPRLSLEEVDRVGEQAEHP